MNLEYQFRDKKYLDKALTHISYANEKGIESNQRLEFLGDSVLSLIITDYIYQKFPEMDEGRLTELRSAVVCEKSLSSIARKLEMGDAIYFGKSEAVCGGKNKDSILCDTFEAILGAMYLDGGFEACRKWVLDNMTEIILESASLDFTNYKSELQTYFQKRDKGTDVVVYRLIERGGPDHCPYFSVSAVYRGKEIGRGRGGSRKEAEQKAAKEAFLATKKNK